MQSFRIAFQSLRSNRVRTGLTTLGIIIGVASITLVLSLGDGAQESVRRQVNKLDNNVLVAKPHGKQNGYDPYGVAITTTLTERDLNTARLNGDLSAVAPVMLLSGSAKTGDKSAINATIVATSPEFAQIIGLKIGPGQFLDNTTSRDTVVIGHKLAVELYGTDLVLGQQLTIKGRPHVVIGVVKNTNAPINLAGIDLDRTVYVSFDDGKSFNQGIAQIQQIIMTTKDIGRIQQAQEDLRQAFLDNHQGERDFQVLAGEEIALSTNSFFREVVIVTAIVAAVTLVVGGIGIMNIMLVGVSERTREIGIRKALGATNRHIFGQFLLEALLMCIVGGLVGLLVAYGLAFAIATQLSFQPAVTWQVTLAGVGMALFIGVLFGLYPAVKAARKDPIESLRQYQ
ncbi:MAG: ABC transporter permease [Acidobacteriota bacterium]